VEHEEAYEEERYSGEGYDEGSEECGLLNSNEIGHAPEEEGKGRSYEYKSTGDNGDGNTLVTQGLGEEPFGGGRSRRLACSGRAGGGGNTDADRARDCGGGRGCGG